jgi:hypothetical protein
LCSHIAELTPHAEEQIILLFERDSVFAVLGYLRFQCFLVSASVISGKGANQKRIISRVTKPATTRYVHWTYLSPALSSTVLAKKTREARRGTTKVPALGTA